MRKYARIPGNPARDALEAIKLRHLRDKRIVTKKDSAVLMERGGLVAIVEGLHGLLEGVPSLFLLVLRLS